MPSRKEDEGVSSFTKLLRLEEFNQVKSPTIRSNPSDNRKQRSPCVQTLKPFVNALERFEWAASKVFRPMPPRSVAPERRSGRASLLG